jgi:hypothetical protein
MSADDEKNAEKNETGIKLPYITFKPFSESDPSFLEQVIAKFPDHIRKSKQFYWLKGILISESDFYELYDALEDAIKQLHKATEREYKKWENFNEGQKQHAKNVKTMIDFFSKYEMVERDPECDSEL